jgi:hypothetical protein
MPSSYSTNLRLELIADGEQTGTWGQTTNRNLGTLIEEAIAGVANVVLAGASDYTLTELDGSTDESRKMVLSFTGGNSQARNIICPAVDKLYLVNNQSNDTLTVKSAAGTNTVVVAAGARSWVFSDAGEFYFVSNSTAVQRAGDTMTGKLTLPATSTSAASITLPHGTAPSAPTNGDIWTATDGLYSRVNGVTYTMASTAYVTSQVSPRVFAYAGKTGDQTGIGTSAVSITFTARQDSGSTFASNVFTAPHTGYYEAEVGLLVYPGAAQNIWAQFQSSGGAPSSLNTHFEPFDSGVERLLFFRRVFNLTAGNTLGVSLITNSGTCAVYGSTTLNSEAGWFYVRAL